MTEPPAERLDKSFGREAFGDDPANYHAARPPYPEVVWRTLRERAGLRPGIDILEIGAGTGLATDELLASGPRRLVAIEPDARLAAFLREHRADENLDVVNVAFEGAELPSGAFDLVASATAFHWLDAASGLLEIRDLLRPGGSLALFWNVFGDASRADPFHLATQQLFVRQKQNPSIGEPGRPPHALDTEARLAELAEAGFDADEPVVERWELKLDPTAVRALYATYSNVTAFPPAEQKALLDGLERVARDEFAGDVRRNMTTIVYTARPAY